MNVMQFNLCKEYSTDLSTYNLSDIFKLKYKNITYSLLSDISGIRLVNDTLYIFPVLTCGEYELQIGYQVKDAGYFSNIKEHVATITLTVNKLKLPKPYLRGNQLIYNQAERHVEIINYDHTFMNLSGTLFAIDSGNYSVYVDLKDPVNTCWEDDSVDGLSLPWYIGKAVKELKLTVVNESFVAGESAELRCKNISNSDTINYVAPPDTEITAKHIVSTERINVSCSFPSRPNGRQVEVYVTSEENRNYYAAESNHVFVTIYTRVESPSLRYAPEYNGELISPDNDLLWRAFDRSLMSISGNSQKDAGMYSVVFTINDPTKYRFARNWKTLEMGWQIVAYKISIPYILDAAWDYDGETCLRNNPSYHAPRVLSDDMYYCVPDVLDEVNASKYATTYHLNDELVAKGCICWEDESTDEKSLNWWIQKDIPTIIFTSPAIDREFDAGEKFIAHAIIKNESGKIYSADIHYSIRDTYYAKITNTSTHEVTCLRKGYATLIASVEETDNYEASSTSFTIYIKNSLPSENNMELFVDGKWNFATPYIYDNGEWKTATAYIYNQGQWKN